MDAIFSTLLRIFEFIIAFGLLVFLHELGHYLAAKLFNIQVEEFGFGFPPRLVKLFQFRETEFTLNWIPFGAFVRPKGENDPEVPGGLASASPWARLTVLFGGPLMNLLTGVVLFSVLFSQLGAPDLSRVLIVEVSENSPAAEAGIQVNDIITEINGTVITSMQDLSNHVRANLGQEVQITLLRGGKRIETSAVPRENPPEGQGALGITMSNPVRPMNLVQAVPYAARLTYEQGRQLLTLPFLMLRGEVSPDEGRFVGPKGIYDIYSAARELDEEEAVATQEPEPILGLNTLSFLATISIALGYTNLLPIPALDGGRILFVLPEILFRRRIPAQYENMIHLIGFTALILLMIYVTTQDIINPIALP
ncbi:MAG: site-2 protease family protein [Chloroflexi bacterium]|nr:site-2 protease family protein [Chloroflexota bacterium]